jgi:hypothetical protein
MMGEMKLNKGILGQACENLENSINTYVDSEFINKKLNIARAEFLLINEKDPEKLLDAIYTWYIKQFGEEGL